MKNRFLTSKDYAKLYERADRILDREISKPSDEWDEGLIEELEETMLYCAERKKVLLSEEKQNRRLQPSFKLRRALVIVVAVLASFIIFATVAQAAGFRVWSALVHWDINYLRVDYTGNTTETPADHDVNNSNAPVDEPEAVTLDFDSFDAVVAYMGNRIEFPTGVDGIEFVSARVTEDDEAAILHTVYRHLDDTVIIDTTTTKSAVLDTITVAKQYNSMCDSVFTRDIYGHECIFGVKDERIYCTFAYGYTVYSIICNAGQEYCISIAESILEGAGS